MNPIQDLIMKDVNEKHPPIIELQSKEHIPVGAIYLSQVKPEDIVISETNNDEKYYLVYRGIAIFFTYYKKIMYN